MYFIKWVGYSAKENTWEPVENLTNVIYMVEEFENKKSIIRMSNTLESSVKAPSSGKEGKDSVKKLTKKRDLKLQDKNEEQNDLDFEDLNKVNEEDNVVIIIYTIYSINLDFLYWLYFIKFFISDIVSRNPHKMSLQR